MTWGDDFLACELLQYKAYQRPVRRHPLSRVGIVGHGHSGLVMAMREAIEDHPSSKILIIGEPHYDIEIDRNKRWAEAMDEISLQARAIDMHFDSYKNLRPKIHELTSNQLSVEYADEAIIYSKTRACNNAQRKNKRKKKVKPKRKRK